MTTTIEIRECIYGQDRPTRFCYYGPTDAILRYDMLGFVAEYVDSGTRTADGIPIFVIRRIGYDPDFVGVCCGGRGVDREGKSNSADTLVSTEYLLSVLRDHPCTRRQARRISSQPWTADGVRSTSVRNRARFGLARADAQGADQ